MIGISHRVTQKMCFMSFNFKLELIFFPQTGIETLIDVKEY